MDKLLNIGTAKRPLSIRLPIVAFLLSLTVAFVVTYALRVEIAHVVKDSNQAYLTEKNRQIQTVIEAIYQEAHDHLAFMSLFPALREIVEKTELDPNMNLDIENDRLKELFKNFLSTRKIYTAVKLTSLASQKALVSVGEKSHNENGNNEKQNSHVNFEKDKLVFSAIEFDDSGRANFQIQRPVYFKHPNSSLEISPLFGVISLRVDFDRFMELLEHYALQEVNFYLSDQKGKLLYTSDKTLAINKNKRRLLKEYFPGVENLPTQLIDKMRGPRAFDHPVSNSRSEAKVETLYQQYQSTFFGQGHQFKWLMQTNEDRLTDEFDEVEGHVLLISMGLALFILILSFIATRNIMKPLVQMIHFIRDGKNEIENLPINAKDEVGVLARTFYNMKLLKNNKDKQLVEAKTDAEKAVLAKNAFFASMSHEIRTPMNGVLGMLGLMMSTGLNKQQKHYATLARSSADSLLTIIDDILDLSKIEAGKIELELLDFDLREQLGIFAEAMAYRAQDKGLELVLDVTAVEQSMVKGDPNRVKQILTNLVGNAIKFTDEGEIFIKASLHPHNKNENEWIFECEVNDTGIGIPADKVDSLFETYSQVDSSTTRKFGGTGLGLAIVKQLAELMNGEVSVSSQLGKGSYFKFSLCLGISHLSKLVLPQQDIKGKRILVVDDNPTNLEVLVGQLEHWQATVFSATSGKRALDIIEQEYNKKCLLDVAILDMGMSGMDGAQLGSKIRSNKQYDQLKLVMMTSMASSGDIGKFKDLGFSAYFPKPATTHDLFHALQVLVEDGTTLEKMDGMVTNYNVTNLTSSDVFSSAQVLLVEDNPINQEVAIGILESMGVCVDIAKNGIQAIEKLKIPDKIYGLVLMDCQMPEMDGYEASRQIRSKMHKIKEAKIPIIAMTANALKGDREKCLDAGMDDYLTKPIDPHELEEKLRRWLPKEQQDHHVKPLASRPETMQVAATGTIIGTGADVTDSEHQHSINLDTDIWDQAELLKRVRNNHKLVAQLVELFLDEMTGSSEKLQQAVKRQDIEAIKADTHKIKGSAGNLSAHAMSKIAATMESAAHAGDMLSIEKNVGEFQRQANLLLRSLKEYKD